MHKKIKRFSMILYLMALVFAAVMLLLISVNEKRERYQARADLGYQTIEEYDCVEAEEPDAPVGIKKIYTWTLPEKIKGDTALAFYFVHQYVRVYLDDELVYSVLPASGWRIGKTLGCDWTIVPLFQEDAGKNIRIEMIPVYKATINRPPIFYIGSKLGIVLAQAKKDKWQIIMSIISIIIGIVFLGIACYYIIERKQKKDLLALGAFSLMLGIWRLADTWFSPLLFAGNPTLLFYLSVTMLMLGAVPLLKMLQSYLYGREYLVIDICCAVFAVLCIVLVGLQLLGIADIREVLTVIHIMILNGVLIAIVLAIYDKIKHKKSEKSGILWICAAGAVMDVIAYYVKGNSSGLFFSLSAFQIYILCTGIITVKEYIDWEKKISEQEAELAESRQAIMLSQIQPHFLYNSLTSIYYLCGKDPSAAKRAINDFADYLRGNMDSLKHKTPVPFEKELKHVEIYLSLEKMRFDEELEIEYDIETKDFMIPSLTVQPLVENAVKHGVGKAPNGGTVRILTREKKDCYEVIVADDGVGYDVNKKQDDGRTHIGITNVKNRLWEMSRATLEIVSVVGEGTTATITIPKQKE